MGEQWRQLLMCNFLDETTCRTSFGSVILVEARVGRSCASRLRDAPLSCASDTDAVVAIPSPTFTLAAVGRNQLDAVFALALLIERIRVVRLVAGESGRELVDKAFGKSLFWRLAPRRRSALGRYGEGKTITSGDNDDLRVPAAAGGGDGEAPFFRAREGRISQ